ncbi:hypothetical protein [Alloalcanivorax xenomutans]
MTERTEHIIRMIIGAVAYLLTVKLIPTWVPGSYRLWMALLPHSGYYAHHPRDLPWYVPVEVTND